MNDNKILYVITQPIYIYIYISVISSQRPKTAGVDYSRIEYIWNIIKIYVSVGCMAIVKYLFPSLYYKTHI